MNRYMVNVSLYVDAKDLSELLDAVGEILRPALQDYNGESALNDYSIGSYIEVPADD